MVAKRLTKQNAMQKFGRYNTKTLKHVINYYSRHVENFGEIKSLKVLSQVFR